MTPRMKHFLMEAATCEPGKGLPLRKHEKHIAAKAVNDGFGMIMCSFVDLFIIDEVGRAAIQEESSA